MAGHEIRPSKPGLSSTLPPILLGGAAFSTQMQSSPHTLPAKSLLFNAFALGITGIDTSPYYGPSEEILGKALQDPEFSSRWPRSSYFLSTKVGRVSANCFDYSRGWVRFSVERSMRRLGMGWLDLVFCHDVEFVSDGEMVQAVRELVRLRGEGKIRYLGISGYPPGELLRRLRVLNEVFGEKVVDAVQNYCHFTLQNGELESHYGELMGGLREGGCVVNSSPLAMGLLRRGGAFGDWHPAPKELREKCSVTLAEWCEREKGEKLANLALKFSVGKAAVLHKGLMKGEGRGMGFNGCTIMGPSLPEELEENFRVLEEIMVDPVPGEKRRIREIDGEKVKRLGHLFEEARRVLGTQWVDYSWESPPRNWEKIREPNPLAGKEDQLKSKI